MCFCMFQMFSRVCFRLGLELKYMNDPSMTKALQFSHVIVVIFPLHVFQKWGVLNLSCILYYQFGLPYLLHACFKMLQVSLHQAAFPLGELFLMEIANSKRKVGVAQILQFLAIFGTQREIFYDISSLIRN